MKLMAPGVTCTRRFVYTSYGLGGRSELGTMLKTTPCIMGHHLETLWAGN